MDLLKALNPEPASYCGSGSFRYVEKLLRSERSILISSPYIDGYYAKYLAHNARGKRIRVLSSSIKEHEARRLRGKPLGKALAFSSMLFAANIMLFLAGYTAAVFLAGSCALAIGALAFRLSDRRQIFLKTPRRFVHAKMYVGEKMAIEGSANLTYAGMHKNIERINIIKDKKKIDELRKQFLSLWDSA